jgi:hypothetical protein
MYSMIDRLLRSTSVTRKIPTAFKRPMVCTVYGKGYMEARKELMCSKVNKWVTISAKRYKCLSKIHRCPTQSVKHYKYLSKPVHGRKKTKIKGKTHTKHLVIGYMNLEHLLNALGVFTSLDYHARHHNILLASRYTEMRSRPIPSLCSTFQLTSESPCTIPKFTNYKVGRVRQSSSHDPGLSFP